MKKIQNVLFVALLNVLLLTSCVNRHTSYFVSGKYQSTDINTSTNTGTVTDIDTDYVYYLEIKNISYDAYVLANGINVVKDDVLKENYYFEIKFYKYIGNNQEIINLINIKKNSRTTTEPISYIDDNGIVIYPHYPTFMHRDNLYYMFDYGTEYIYFERIE